MNKLCQVDSFTSVQLRNSSKWTPFPNVSPLLLLLNYRTRVFIELKNFNKLFHCSNQRNQTAYVEICVWRFSDSKISFEFKRQLIINNDTFGCTRHADIKKSNNISCIIFSITEPQIYELTKQFKSSSFKIRVCLMVCRQKTLSYVA